MRMPLRPDDPTYKGPSITLCNKNNYPGKVVELIPGDAESRIALEVDEKYIGAKRKGVTVQEEQVRCKEELTFSGADFPPKCRQRKYKHLARLYLTWKHLYYELDPPLSASDLEDDSSDGSDRSEDSEGGGSSSTSREGSAKSGGSVSDSGSDFSPAQATSSTSSESSSDSSDSDSEGEGAKATPTPTPTLRIEKVFGRDFDSEKYLFEKDFIINKLPSYTLEDSLILNGLLTGSSSTKEPYTYAISFRVLEDYHLNKLGSYSSSPARQLRYICRSAGVEEEECTETMCRRFRKAYAEFVGILQAVEFLEGVTQRIPGDPNPFPQVSVLPSSRRRYYPGHRYY